MDGPVVGSGSPLESVPPSIPGPEIPDGPSEQKGIYANVSTEDERDGKEKKELSIDELRKKVRNSRWNVFFYLGLAALLFLFALIPLPVPAPWNDESIIIDSKGSDGQIFRDMPYLIGMPIIGEDFTDVTVYVEVKRTDAYGGSEILIAMIEGSCSDQGVNDALNDLESEDPNATSRNFAKIENAKVNKIEEVKLQVDPGQYCLVVEYEDYPLHNSPSLEVTASVYGLREIGLLLGVFSLIWAGFGFVGAQRKGRELKERTEPRKKAESVEKQVINATTTERIAAGPQTSPTGPQTPPPTDLLQSSTEPQPVQSVTPAPVPSVESVSSPTSESLTPIQPLGIETQASPLTPQTTIVAKPPDSAVPQGNYVKSNDGYYYLLKSDNTYDSQPFILQADGTYLPYQ